MDCDADDELEAADDEPDAGHHRGRSRKEHKIDVACMH